MPDYDKVSLVFSRKFHSAYDFLEEDDINLLGYSLDDFEEEDELVHKLIQVFGSDEDIINEVLRRTYPHPHYFYTITFQEPEETFLVRVWQMWKESKPTRPTWLRDKHTEFYYKITSVLQKYHIPESASDLFLKYFIRHHKHDVEDLANEDEETILDIFWDNVYWAFAYLT